MTFRTRLYAAFAVSAAFTLALGAFAIVQIAGLTAHTHHIASHWLPSIEALAALKSEMREFRTQELQHLLSTEAAEMDEWEGRMKRTLDSIDAKFTAYERLATTDVERTAIAELKRLQAARVEGHMRLRALSRAHKRDEALALARGEIAKLRASTAAKIDEMIAHDEKGVEHEVADSEASAATAKFMVPVAMLLAALASAACAVVLVRSTMARLGGDPDETRAAVDRIASGDLATPIALRAGDETSLLASLARMRTGLSEVVGTIVVGSEQIRIASAEVARGNLDLSSRTEQQSSSLQETASALEEMTGTIRATSDNAASADSLAKSASETAERGGRAVDAVVRTMHSIADSSRRVRDIISVIDGIAFQTNILALNAAVEAARAGEQGRGFAVVASEVRSLAQRSAEAAREIKSLIEASTGQVDDGARLVGDAGATMHEVVESVKRVAAIIGEIASAATEQSTGVGQINEAVGQLDAVTQQNAALVEQAAAATRSMEEQADRLVEAVSTFRLEAASSARCAAPAVASAAAGPGRPTAGRTAPVRAANPPAPRPRAAATVDSGWNDF
ncbi:MAG TPA: methyl-accepting chemotaxis protein [Burkholderiaceae bacterium]|nr:methyl-accepting chemotaxis protein [Burkholderiaceae bacterium]